MNLAQTSFLSLLATAIKMSSGFVINKTAAVYIGPSGIALIGQLQNVVQLVLTLGQGAINSGVTKYTAELSSDDKRLSELLSTASKISLCCSIITGVMLFIFSESASLYFLKSLEFTYILRILAITTPLFVFNSLALSILNGLKETRVYLYINIIQSTYSLIFTSFLILIYSLHGAMIALATNQAVVFFIVLFALRNHKFANIGYFSKNSNMVDAKKLAAFSLMTGVTMLLTPVTLTLVRNHIIQTDSMFEAGLWQSMWYLSTMYLLAFMTIIRVYFLPIFSKNIEPSELRREIFSGLYFFIPIGFCVLTSIYLMRDYLILLLFSDEFLKMRELFFWQLTGDFLKLLGTLFGILMAAKAKHFRAILINIVCSSAFVFSVLTMYQSGDLIELARAHFISNLVFVCLSILLTWNILNEKL
jgi:O-antigen/teichoic acid export membrane protein